MDSTRLIDQLIRTSFPHPVAATWHRVSLVTSDADRIDRLFGSLEVTIRLLDGILLADYLRGPADEAVDRALENLERPSMGHWVQLLRALVKAIKGRRIAPFVPEILPWYLEKGRPSEVAKQIDELVQLRNDHVHGHRLAASEQEARVNYLIETLRTVLGRLDFLAGYRLFRVMTSDWSRQGRFDGRVQFLSGVAAQAEPIRAHWKPPLLADCVYLTNPDGSAFLEVSPFLMVLHDAGPREDRVFVMAATRKRKKLLLKNDVTGGEVSRLITSGDGDVAFDRWLEVRPKTGLFIEDPKGSREFRSDTVRTDGREVLGDRFEVRGRLGEGGMATVFHVWDQWDEEEFALKVLRQRLSDDALFRERFTREARTMKRLNHPHIVKVHETAQIDDGRLYLKMPLITGGTLQDRVDAGRSPVEFVRRWGLQMLSALAYLHGKGIVHRDIKPSNFLVDAQENVYLTDFGIAVQDDDVRLTRTLEQMGSMAYMSPEQRQGGEVGPPTDVYSLGVVLHELVTGKPGANPPGRGIGGALGSLVRDLCIEDPEERPTADEARERLARYQPPGQPRIVPPDHPAGVAAERAELPPVEWVEVPPGQIEMSGGRTCEITIPLQAGPRVDRLLWSRVQRLPDPVVTTEGADEMTWLQAVEFCNKLSVELGLTPPYTLSDLRPRKRYGIDDIGRMLLEVLPRKRRDLVLSHFGTKALDVMQFDPQQLTQLPGIGAKTAERYGSKWPREAYFVRDVAWDRSADGWRLPTEAEWVLVSRAVPPEPDAADWTWDADPGPAVQTVPTPLPDGHHVDPCLDDGALRIVRSAAGRGVRKLHEAAEGLGFRIVRGAHG